LRPSALRDPATASRRWRQALTWGTLLLVLFGAAWGIKAFVDARQHRYASRAIEHQADRLLGPFVALCDQYRKPSPVKLAAFRRSVEPFIRLAKRHKDEYYSSLLSQKADNRYGDLLGIWARAFNGAKPHLGEGNPCPIRDPASTRLRQAAQDIGAY